jgi:hypothetical protein
MPVDTNSVVDDAAAYRELAHDLYDSLMKALQALWFDVPFGPTENTEASEVCIRARRVLGVPPTEEEKNCVIPF